MSLYILMEINKIQGSNQSGWNIDCSNRGVKSRSNIKTRKVKIIFSHEFIHIKSLESSTIATQIPGNLFIPFFLSWRYWKICAYHTPSYNILHMSRYIISYLIFSLICIMMLYDCLDPWVPSRHAISLLLLIFILTVCSFNFANNLQTLLALVLTVYCSRNIKLTEDTGAVHKYQSCRSLYFSVYCRM